MSWAGPAETKESWTGPTLGGALMALALGGALMALAFGGALVALALRGALVALSLGGALVALAPAGALECWTEPAGVLESTCEESTLDGTHALHVEGKKGENKKLSKLEKQTGEKGTAHFSVSGPFICQGRVVQEGRRRLQVRRKQQQVRSNQTQMGTHELMMTERGQEGPYMGTSIIYIYIYIYTVGTESIQTPLHFSLFVILQPFAKII